MRTTLILLTLMFFGLSMAPATAQPRAAASLPACVAVSQEAPYRGYGYNHIVVLTSTCTRAYVCSVRTNAAPTPTSAPVAAGQTVRVSTFVGSPAREFSPTVTCE